MRVLRGLLCDIHHGTRSGGVSGRVVGLKNSFLDGSNVTMLLLLFFLSCGWQCQVDSARDGASFYSIFIYFFDVFGTSGSNSIIPGTR